MTRRRTRAVAAGFVLLATTVSSCGTGAPAASVHEGSRTASVPLAGSSWPTNATGATPTAGSSTAPPGPGSPTPSPTSTLGQIPVIVIDPGHSGRTIRSITRNGLRDIDYPNYPEIYEAFDVSWCVARSLRADGYRVLLTKRQALSSVSHTQRAAVANDNHAALAISVHDDHGVGPRFEATYDQRGVRHNGAYSPMYRGEGVHRTVFSSSATARQSQRYAGIIAAARTRAQGRAVTVQENSFNGRAPLESGNLALVQLFSDVPWVYNEMGALTDGHVRQAMSVASETGYADGLLAGIEAAVPLVPGRPGRSTSSAGTLTSCLTRRLEPQPGQFTRPQEYLPHGFG